MNDIYLVVCFPKTNEVDVVPSGWVREDGRNATCLWPPYKSDARLMRAKKASEMPTADWTSHDAKILYRAGLLF